MEFEIEKVGTYNKAQLVEFAKSLHAENESLKASGAAPDEKDALINALKAENDQLKSANSEQESALVELNSKLSSAEKNRGNKGEVIEINGSQYLMTAGSANYKGIKVTPQMLRDDKGLAKELVEIGAGYLVKQ